MWYSHHVLLFVKTVRTPTPDRPRVPWMPTPRRPIETTVTNHERKTRDVHSGPYKKSTTTVFMFFTRLCTFKRIPTSSLDPMVVKGENDNRFQSEDQFVFSLL